MTRSNLAKGLLGSAVALSLFAAPAMAAANFSDWDTNGDANLTNEEFATGFKQTGVFDEWDTNNDNRLSQSELEAGHAELDMNKGKFKDEFAFNEWDKNSDSYIAEDEFYNSIYSVYDDDKDNIIEEPEFADVGDDVGDGGFWDV